MTQADNTRYVDSSAQSADEVRVCQHDEFVELEAGVFYRRCRRCDAMTCSLYGDPSPLPPWLLLNDGSIAVENPTDDGGLEEHGRR